jgi:endonuclease/exonuclease/phosphatase (EEP) superfamily protein YafD
MKKLALVLACGLLLGSSAPPAAEISAPGDLRVASYNVNYGLAGDPETLDALIATNADVVFVQEANAAWADAFLDLRDRWPHQAIVDHGAAGGLAVLSRFPFDEGEVVPSAVGWFPAWKVTVDTPAGPLQALQVHLHPPFDDRWGWAAGPFTTSDERELELVAALEVLDGDVPTVVLGDFNERRGRAIRLMEDRGFEDVLPRFAPGEKTWSWDLPVGRLSGTLDHVFTGGGARAVGAAVRDEGRSDHRPIVVDVVLR